MFIVLGLVVLVGSVLGFYLTSDAFDERSAVLVTVMDIGAGSVVSASDFGSELAALGGIPHVPFTPAAASAFEGLVAVEAIAAGSVVTGDMFVFPDAAPLADELEVVVALDTGFSDAPVNQGDTVLLIDPGVEPTAANPGRPRLAMRALELDDFDGSVVRLWVPPEEWAEWRSLSEVLGATPQVLPVALGGDAADLAQRLNVVWRDEWLAAVEAATPVVVPEPEPEPPPAPGPGELEVLLEIDAALAPGGLAEGDRVLLIDPGRRPAGEDSGRPRAVIAALDLELFDGTEVRLFVPPDEWARWSNLPATLGGAPLALPVPEGSAEDAMIDRLDGLWAEEYARLHDDWAAGRTELPEPQPGEFLVALPLNTALSARPPADGDQVPPPRPRHTGRLRRGGTTPAGTRMASAGRLGRLGAALLGRRRPLGLLHVPAPTPRRAATGPSSSPSRSATTLSKTSSTTSTTPWRAGTPTSLQRRGRAAEAVLALITANGARLDAGSVGLAIARGWSDDGRQVLFIDADTSGTRLAARLGEATRAAYAPAERGLPSLMAARQPLTLKLLAEHCYSLDTAPGSLWSLFAPQHPAGAAHAAAWLAERRQPVAELSRTRAVIVTSPALEADSPLLPLLRLARAVVFLAPAATPEQATALGELCDHTGLARVPMQHRLLAVEGSSTIADKALRAASGLHVIGRLPALEDERILRRQNTRRERALHARHPTNRHPPPRHPGRRLHSHPPHHRRAAGTLRRLIPGDHTRIRRDRGVHDGVRVRRGLESRSSRGPPGRRSPHHARRRCPRRRRGSRGRG